MMSASNKKNPYSSVWIFNSGTEYQITNKYHTVFMACDINELQSSTMLAGPNSFRIEKTNTSNREALLSPAPCLEQKKRNEIKLPVLN